MGKIKENNIEFSPIVALPPGETIKDFINTVKMTQGELANRLGVSVKHMSNIINGIAPITYDTALSLEKVIGPSAEFWMNLETNYQLDKARIEEERNLEKDSEILKLIPYNEMSKLGWIDKTSNKNEKIKNMRDFFKVSSLTCIENSYAVAFRQSKTSNKISNYAVLAWLKMAEDIGNDIEVDELNRGKLKKLIPTFRELTLKNPEEFYPIMKQLCAEYGIALVLVESLPKTYICGATIWRGNKAILALSVRGKKADIFWFTFFHEIAHLVEHSKKEFHISYDKDNSQEEHEADQKARNYLIEDEQYEKFIKDFNYTSVSDISYYAKQIGVHPCILVGRLLHDKLIDYSKKYNDLRPSFKIVRNQKAS